MFGLGIKNGENEIAELDLSRVKPHPQDSFESYPDDRLRELADSIAGVGLLEPIIVRAIANGDYEILAGKNRSNAVRLIGNKKIKAIIRDVDDDMAIMIVTDSNLKHREKLLPSEKGYAYKLQLEAIKKQGKRDVLADDDTSVQFAQKFSRDIVAEYYKVSKDEVQRFIRLTNLIPTLIDAVDNEKVPLVAGVNLSFLDEEAQKEVYNYFFVVNNDMRLSLNISATIKQAYSDGKAITADNLDTILARKKNTRQTKPFSISRKKLKGFAGKIPDDKELEKLFIEFLKSKFNM